jgi:hypothetical protein
MAAMATIKFGTIVDFRDRASGQNVRVGVYGWFEGTGVEANEMQPIADWIGATLGTTASGYDGNVADLPARLAEWGAAVDAQLAPAIAQHFGAQGRVHISGVSTQPEAAATGKPAYAHATAPHGAPGLLDKTPAHPGKGAPPVMDKGGGYPPKGAPVMDKGGAYPQKGAPVVDKGGGYPPKAYPPKK